MTTRTEIEAILRTAGPMFDGGDSLRRAELVGEWDDYFDGDVDAVQRWVEAGYWCPATAYAVAHAGHSAGDVPSGHDDPIYALCNGDATIESLDWS